jgi:type I restriction enzyme S subunit
MLPEGWQRVPLHEVAEVRTGLAKGKTGQRDPVELPYLRVANVQDGHLDLSEIKTITVEREHIDRYSLHRGDILMTEGGDFDKLGRGDVWQGQIEPCLHQNHVFAVRLRSRCVDSFFLAALAASHYGRTYFLSCAKRSTNLASINSSQLKAFPVLLPPIAEQQFIAGVLATWDEAIVTTALLLANSRKPRQGLMQQVLTGQKRLVQFRSVSGMQRTPHGLIPTDWEYPRIEDVAQEVVGKRGSSFAHPVLSCTKHDGLVDSLKYFNKQVFSTDTSTYKVVPRGCFVYATNHIEEGSIGYQDLYELGLVSPMYTVFKTNDKACDGYLYRLLKTEHYRQIFAAATNASVDRRGSLRWKDFKKIRVPLPSLEEQRAISGLLDTMNREIEFLAKQLALLRREKAALMQQLLTGKRRVRLPESSSETVA